MAPEQAAADPHVDHRADLYSVGVLAYEMLCGRTPFAAPTPQAMLAAHITQPAEPVIQHRKTVPPALSAAVMRCLEKHAADRWQSAGELAAQLEAAGSGSVSHPVSDTQPGISSGTEAAIRRGHPGRVTVLFLTASALILVAVYGMIQWLGLPDWVLYGAGVLLAVGLPITLAAGIHERKRAQARTTGLATATPTGLAPWVSWRRALLGGALGFAALALLAGVYTAMRLLGIGPVGTLVASGVLAEREPLLLSDFENRSPDSTLGESLTEAFRVDLSQSPTLRLIDPASVLDALQRMGRSAEAVLTPALARELAERQGVKAVVVGQIDPVGRGYVLSASLIGATDGKVLTAVRESADDQATLLPAIDQLSKKLRERIGESLKSIRANPPLEDVTTGSLEALRKYTAALRLEDNDRGEEAIPVLEEAVALDSGFAMAWRKLAVLLGNTGQSRTREVAAVSRAYQHRDRLPSIERNLAVAYYHNVVEPDPAREMSAYRAVLDADPDNVVALNNLSIVLSDHRRYAEAESLASRATQLGRGTVFYFNTIQAQLGQGKLDEAQLTADRYSQSAPKSPFAAAMQASMLLVKRDFGAAEPMFRSLLEKRESPFLSLITTLSLAGLAEQQGRIRESQRLLQQQLQSTIEQHAPWDYLRFSARLALLESRYGGAPDGPMPVLRAALDRYPLASMQPLDRPYLELITAYAESNQPDEAGRLLREYESVVPEGIRRSLLFEGRARGSLAKAAGDHQRAVEHYRDWQRRDGNCGSCAAFELGLLYDRAGQRDSAIAQLEQVTRTPTIDAVRFAQYYAYAPSLKRLGELYEAGGDRKKAADYYGRFVDLWKNADPELQPAVREARTRLAQLAREPGG